MLLAGCTDQGGTQSAGTASAAREPVANVAAASASPNARAEGVDSVASGDAMPGDACSVEGYWSFFEAFVRTPRLRATYSDGSAHAALASFDVAQQDSRWVRAGDPTIALDIREHREGPRFEVEATPVELDADDEIVRRLGEAKHYRFEFKDGCWRFAGLG